jgi:hypothetical protein
MCEDYCDGILKSASSNALYIAQLTYDVHYQLLYHKVGYLTFEAIDAFVLLRWRIIRFFLCLRA